MHKYMREELLESILHTYRNLREDINKLRNEQRKTQTDIEKIIKLIENKPKKKKEKLIRVLQPERLIEKKGLIIQREMYLNKTFVELEKEINEDLIINPLDIK